MKILDTPKVLTDKAKFQEIYDLRVLAYEHSHKAQYVNRQVYPNGWKDDLDELDNTIHWVIESNGKIIAAARLAILEDMKQTGEFTDKFEFPKERPFAYWSRLVVHPDYRHSNAMMQLDHARKNYLLQKPEIKFAICWSTPERKNSILRLGFKCIGESEYKWGGGSLPISVYFLFTNAKANA